MYLSCVSLARMAQINRPIKTEAERSDNCAMNFAYEVLGQKWNLQIIMELTNTQYYDNNSMSYTDVADLIPEISSKILSKRLKRLADLDIIEITYKKETPKKLRYRLSALGIRLIPIIDQLRKWSLTSNRRHDKICIAGHCRHAVDVREFLDE